MASIFKPAGIPARYLNVVVLTLDEFEALRLADLEGLYQEQAALRMGVSRATFGRIVEVAHRKVADALVSGKALRIEGGPVYSESALHGILHEATPGQTVSSPERTSRIAPAVSGPPGPRTGRLEGAAVHEHPGKESFT